jgi:hypothetical protein
MAGEESVLMALSTALLSISTRPAVRKAQRPFQYLAR